LIVSIGPSTASTVPRTRTAEGLLLGKACGCGKQQRKSRSGESAPCHLVHYDPPEPAAIHQRLPANENPHAVMFIPTAAMT